MLIHQLQHQDGRLFLKEAKVLGLVLCLCLLLWTSVSEAQKCTSAHFAQKFSLVAQLSTAMLNVLTETRRHSIATFATRHFSHGVCGSSTWTIMVTGNLPALSVTWNSRESATARITWGLFTISSPVATVQLCVKIRSSIIGICWKNVVNLKSYSVDRHVHNLLCDTVWHFYRCISFWYDLNLGMFIFVFLKEKLYLSDSLKIEKYWGK